MMILKTKYLMKPILYSYYKPFLGKVFHLAEASPGLKELLNRLANAEDPRQTAEIFDLSAREVMMAPYFVPDSMRLSQLLTEFTNNRRQIAIVLDEYGGTEGLITLEDILEEIVGDYEDEFSPRHRHIRRKNKGHFIINGGVRVTELEPKLNFPFPTGDYVTLGGLINHRLERIAKVGDVVDMEGGRLEVLDMDLHRITKVRFEFRVAEEEEHDAVPVDEPVQTRKAEEPGDQNAPDSGGEPLSEQLNVDPSSAVTPFKKKTGS